MCRYKTGLRVPVGNHGCYIPGFKYPSLNIFKDLNKRSSLLMSGSIIQ